MKCKHMHKDMPENAICKDCFEIRDPDLKNMTHEEFFKIQEETYLLGFRSGKEFMFKMMKGGNNHGRK